MTTPDPHACTRALIDNSFKYLTWHDDVCHAAGFKGISQVWKEYPAWYIWTDSAPGGYLLRMCSDEPMNDSQYVSLSLHYFPHPDEPENNNLSPEETGLIQAEDFFDQRTSTPNFEKFEEFLPFFVTAEIGLVIGSDNKLKLLIYTTVPEKTEISFKLLDLLIKTLNFFSRSHHRNVFQLDEVDYSSIFIEYDTMSYEKFLKSFNFSKQKLKDISLKDFVSGWKRFSNYSSVCSVKGTCSCH